MHHWGSRTTPGPLLALLDPGVRVGGVQLHQIAIRDILQLWFYELLFIVSDHGSRRTWGPGPSRSIFGAQTGDPPPLNQGRTATFVFTKMQLMLQRHPIPRVWGVPGQPPRTFQPSRTTSMPNYIPIRPKVWTSIKNTHTSCPLYSRIWWGAFSKLVSIICWNVKKKLDINDQDLSNLAKQREKVLFLPDICFAWLPRRASL